MAKATRSLSAKKIAERTQRYRQAVYVRAMQCARTAVKHELQAQGHKVHHFSAKEITLLAEDYFAKHTMELIIQAEEDIATWPGFARWRLPVVEKIPETEHSPRAASDNQRTIQQ